MPDSTSCAFCDILAGAAPATVVETWDDAVAIVPLNPVVDGHVLIIPRVHVPDALADPDVSAATMRRACQLGRSLGLEHANIITSKGKHATQSVEHLHLHLAPRQLGDGLPLLWTPQQGELEFAVAVPDPTRITVVSFGWLHGQPPPADLVIDLRPRLRDPHTDPTLRELTGHDQTIRDKVRATSGYETLHGTVAEAAQALAAAGDRPVRVAVGCAGGRHRSVVVAEDVAALLRDWLDEPITVWHRDIGKPVVHRPAGGGRRG